MVYVFVFVFYVLFLVYYFCQSPAAGLFVLGDLMGSNFNKWYRMT